MKRYIAPEKIIIKRGKDGSKIKPLKEPKNNAHFLVDENKRAKMQAYVQNQNNKFMRILKRWLEAGDEPDNPAPPH